MSAAAASGAELERLAALVRAWLGPQPPVLADGIASPALIALAERQRVAGLLYDLGQRGTGAGGEALRTAFRASYYRTLLRNDALLDAAGRAVAALEGSGIRAVRLKGADLLAGVYPSPALRPMDDVDVLVAPADIRPALAALARAGFRPPPGALSIERTLEHHFHVTLLDPRHGATVELHWELLDRYKRGSWSSADVLARSEPLDRAHPELGRRLDAESGLLYLALHLDKHGPFHELLRRRRGAAVALLHPSSEGRLLWLVDLALQARARPPDPVRVAALARDTGLARAAAASLALARDLLGVDPLPEIRLSAPRPGPWRRLVEAATASVLLLPHPAVGAWLERARRMDQTAQVRPLRLLELPLLLLPPFAEFRSARRLGLGGALVCYPRHVLAETLRLARFALAWRRARRVGGAGEGA